jgi:HD-like signal output (HDOD) protein
VDLLAPALQGVEAWVDYLAGVELPVLDRTASELAAFERDLDRVTGPRLSALTLHDPMMTLKVLQYLQVHRPPRLSLDITTIEHAIMMLGITRFFQHFGKLSTLQQTLGGCQASSYGARRVLYRARHAALYARDWARLRHDIEVDELCIAALLHDLAEMLLWCFAPALPQKIEALQAQSPMLSSHDAEVQVLGFPLIELQLQLAKRWHLPPLLHKLMDDEHAETPRVRTVALAVRFARHVFSGWDHPALPGDYAAIRQQLDLTAREIEDSVRRVTIAAAHEWLWYGATPAAALWPLLPEAPQQSDG